MKLVKLALFALLSAASFAQTANAQQPPVSEAVKRSVTPLRADEFWLQVASREALTEAIAVAEQLLGPECEFRTDHAISKPAGSPAATPWHQDQPYYNVDGRQNVSMWLPVDPVSRGATLEFVAGSHLGPWLMPRTFLKNEAKWFPEGSLADLPDIDANRDDYDIIGWALEPGDAVFFNMLTLHASAGVSGSHRRRAFSVRFLGDDMTHAPRPWTTSPPFPGLENELAAGVPMHHVLFPLLNQARP